MDQQEIEISGDALRQLTRVAACYTDREAALAYLKQHYAQYVAECERRRGLMGMPSEAHLSDNERVRGKVSPFKDPTRDDFVHEQERMKLLRDKNKIGSPVYLLEDCLSNERTSPLFGGRRDIAAKLDLDYHGR